MPGIGVPSFAGKGIPNPLDLLPKRNDSGRQFLLQQIRAKINDPNTPRQLLDNLSRLYEGVSSGRINDREAMQHVDNIIRKTEEIRRGVRGPGHTRSGVAGGLTPDDLTRDPNNEEDAPYTGPNYIDMLKEQMSKARSNVEANFGAALQEIANAEGQTNQAAAAAPGIINDRYAAAQANQNTNASALFNAVQQSGLGQFAQPTQEATMAPLQQALTLDQAAAMTGIDFTKMGLGQYYAQQRGDLAKQKAQMMADLDSEEASTMLSAYEKEADRQEAARQALAEGKGTTIPAFGKREVSQALGGEILSSAANPERFQQGLTDFDPRLADTLRATPAYQKEQQVLQRAVRKGQKGKKKKATKLIQKATTGRRALNHPKAASLAMADNPGLIGYFAPKG